MIKQELAPWTNRVHADDLVSIIIAAMEHDHPSEVYNVTDGQAGNMTDYFNRVAEAAGLPLPPLIDLDQAKKQLSPGMLSYLGESRRISNEKMLRELGVVLQYPTLDSGLRAIFHSP